MLNQCSFYYIIYLQLNGLWELSSLGINPPNIVQSPGSCIWEFTVDQKNYILFVFINKINCDYGISF